MFDIEEIKKIAPHRYPFLMIDRVLEVEPGKKVVAIKNASINEAYFAGHFPGKPIMPGALIVEAMAQASLMLLGEGSGKGGAYYFTLVRIKFLNPVFPGDQLKITVTPIKIISDKGLVSVCATAGEREVAQGEIGFSMLAGQGNTLTPQERTEISGIFTKKYYELTYAYGVNYAAHLILQLFQKMGILEELRERPASADEIICKFNFIPKSRYALEWMFAFLAQGAFLKVSGETEPRKYYYDRDGAIEPEVFLKKGLELDAHIEATSGLMNYVISEYANFFKGAKSGLEILFSGDKAQLWSDYFSNENSGYCVHNAIGAFAVTKWLAGRDGVRLLELGAGTGGATAALLDRLNGKGELSKVSEYIFSDVSPVFLRTGNRIILSRVGEEFRYDLKRLDFEKPLAKQGLEDNSVDVIYAVNALHVAKDLASALKNIYAALKPGGMVILSEHCRPSATYRLFQEFIFTLLDSYVEVNLNSGLRPIPGFLDAEHWKRNLALSGFKNIEVILNTDGAYAAELQDKIDTLAMVIKGEKE